MEYRLLKARAKINLALEVLGKRADGYHDLRSVMQTVSLSDTVLIKRIRKRNHLKLATNLPFLPCDHRNIAHKAASLLMERFDIKDGLFIQIDKSIPVSAGLAGGSADCAAVLVGVRSLFALPVTDDELHRLGLSLGADVPFCLMRGTALAEGVGERLTTLPPLPMCWLLLVKPPVIVSTADVFAKLPATRCGAPPDIERMLAAIKRRDLKGLCAAMANDLETVTAAMHPVIPDIKTLMMENGALGALMSGSGPTVFGVYETREKAVSARDSLRHSLPHLRDMFITRVFNVF